MRMSLFLFFVFCFLYIVNKMEQPQDTIEERTKSVNPKYQGPLAPGPFEPTKGEHDFHVVSTEALFKISQDMARVLDRLMDSRALID